jgi:peptidoglycan-associated lipoprotein
MAQPMPLVPAIDPVAVEFATTTGGTVVFFGVNGVVVAAPAMQSLSRKAQWLLQHPEIAVRIEGHGDGSDTRDHALAMGARRAAAVRDQLVLFGVPASQLTTSSWGNLKPGAGRVEIKLVR